MKRILFLAVLILLVVGLADASGTKKTLSNYLSKGQARAVTSFTVGSGYIDTLVYTREPEVCGLSFYIYATDSINTDRVTIRRMYTGGIIPAAQTLTVDTVDEFTAWAPNATIQGASCVKYGTIDLAPLADVYYIIVDLGTNTGVSGGATMTAYYGIQKQYYYKP